MAEKSVQIKNINAGIFYTMAGSWAIALKNLGINIVWHFMPKERIHGINYQEVFHLNFPKVLVTDKYEEICDNKVDIIVGSPPCVGMSSANKSSSLNHVANLATLHFSIVVDVLRPKAFIMEMVPMIITPKFKPLFDEYKKNFENNYNFQYQIIKFEDYGVPHHRKRFIIIGIRKDLEKDVVFPIPSFFATTVKMAFNKLPRLTEEEAIRQNLTIKFNPKWKGSWSAYLRPSNPYQLRWDKIAPCVTALDTFYFKHPDFLLEDKAYRRLITWREAARLQEFPDDFQFIGRHGDKIREVAWGVPCIGICYFIQEALKLIR